MAAMEAPAERKGAEVAKDKYLHRLQSLQKIRAQAGGRLALPQICVVGDQSSGKSALLSTLTGVLFPVSSGTCTRAPTVVQCERGAGGAGQGGAFSGDLFHIRDPATQCDKLCANVEDLRTQIMQAQQALLSKLDTVDGVKLCNGEGENAIANSSVSATTKAAISTEEICVRVAGPQQMDIIVIDLPGIIHNGVGAEETRELIRRYCQHTQTLTLLVSEAKQDVESIEAIAIAKKYDPDGKRTLRVLTKFDVFDSPGAEARAQEWVCAERYKTLGCHAVVCRRGGCESYDEGADADLAEKGGLPAERCGVPSLQARLPALFSELIAANLPDLRRQVELQLGGARDTLHLVGMQPAVGLAMIHKFQNVVDDRNTFECKLTPHMVDFREKVHETRNQITKCWTDEMFEANAFEVATFQGNAALMMCMSEMVKWWAPLLEQYIGKVAETARASMQLVACSGVPSGFAHAVQREWASTFDQVLAEFRQRCNDRKSQERGFGTINHDLELKYQEGVVLPEELLEELSKNLGDKINAFRTQRRPLHQLIREYLEQERSKWVQGHSEKDLFDQQKVRLFDAMNALATVERKTFIDIVLKETRDVIIQKRQDWISHEIYANKQIADAAVEDPETERERTKAVAWIKTMESCLQELDRMD